MAESHLAGVGEERRVGIGPVTLYRGRRRPSGDPLSRIGFSITTLLALLALVGLAAIWGLADIADGAWDDADGGVVRWLAANRTEAVEDLMDGVQALGSPWFLRVLLWGGVVLLGVFRRWRQMLVAATSIVGVEWVASRVALSLARPRPVGADIAGDWEGFSHPSVPVAGLAVALVVLGLSLVPAGRWRRWWMGISASVVAAVAFAGMYLGTDHLTDVATGAVFGWAAGLAAFGLFAPGEAFPIEYRRAKVAHLPITGARAARLRRALQEQLLDDSGPRATTMRRALVDQLGCEIVRCEVIEVAPFGLAGSAGSTPLRIEVEGTLEGELFAKLYATNHLRSDRWYKLGRAILYGRLEDERPFSSVRRLVEYEDYMLRVMHSAGVPSPRPYGIVRLVAAREYLVVTEFFDGASEISEADVDEAVVVDGLGVVRTLWDADLAHRDIKPANVLVRKGKVHLIDVAFGEIRPSPWRKAVDLANMMLILALHVPAETVYRLAREMFSERDIAEAFAATRGLTIPSQLRSMLKDREADGGVDLIEEFRRLAPECPPIAVQRWSLRRVGLALVTSGIAVGLAALVVQNLRGVDLL